MTPTTACPGSEQIFAYSVGNLSVAELEAVAQHLDGCSGCQSHLARLPSRADAFARMVGEAGRVTPFGEADELPHAAAHDTPGVSPQPTAAEQPSAARTATPPPAPAPQRPGAAAGEPPAQLREYRLLEKIGQGGMGAVYRALHTRLDKVVALKVLPARSAQDPAAVARFQREMKAVGKLDHDNLVRATDAGEVEGVSFLVMEYVAGVNLADLVRLHGRLAAADACELIRQAAVGLEHAHAGGLIHRDIKPSNLLVTPAGQVKVLDLGLALLQGSHPAGADQTESGMVMGTFDYIAPEQGDDAHAVDGRADLYSLGCTLYHLLAGAPPFHARPGLTPVQKLQAHALTPVPPIREKRPDVSEALAGVLERLLAKDPAQRFARAADVSAALAPLSAGANLPGLLAGRSEGPAGGALVAAPPNLGRAARSRRRRFGPAVAAALLLAVAGAVAAAVVLRIQTSNGVLEIDTVDDGVKVVVEKGGDLITIMDLTSKKQIELKAGKYQLRLGDGGDALELDLNDVTLERNGKAIARITRKREPPPGVAAAPAVPRVLTLLAADLPGYRGWLERLRQTGHRPTFVHAYFAGSQPRFCAIAIADSKGFPWEATVRLDEDEDQKAYNDLTSRGYLLVSCSGCRDGDTIRYDGLYVKNGRTVQAAYLLPSIEEGREKLKEMEQQQSQPLEIKVFRARAEWRVSILAVAGDGTPSLARLDLTVAQLEAFLKEDQAKGFHLISLSANHEGGEPLFAVVLLRSKPPLRWQWQYGLPLGAFRQANEHWTALGFRPVAITTYPTARGLLYAGVWVKDGLAGPP